MEKKGPDQLQLCNIEKKYINLFCFISKYLLPLDLAIAGPLSLLLSHRYLLEEEPLLEFEPETVVQLSVRAQDLKIFIGGQSIWLL